MALPNFLFGLLFTILKPFRWMLSKPERKILPSIEDPILKLSATKLASKIRKKEISSEKVVTAYIKRIKEVNGILNAIVEERFDAALEDAKLVDKNLANNVYNEDLQVTKPLLGVPLTVKESCGLGGLSQTGCTLLRKGIKAEKDGEAVSRLKAAGAIPLLVSNTPELCLNAETTNFLFGTTVNPYNSTKSCGGSSGGEGALLGAGASIMGIGSDIGGSVRIPGMYNGIFAHKATAEIIPIVGHFPWWTDETCNKYLTMGPMVRYAEDLPLMAKVMCGENADKIKIDENVSLSKLNIFTLEENLYVYPLTREIKAALDKCVNYLQEVCSPNIGRINYINLKECLTTANNIIFGLQGISDIFEDNPAGIKVNLYTEFIKSLFGLSKYSIFVLYTTLHGRLFPSRIKENRDKSVKQNEILKQKLADSLGTSGILVFPTCSTPACNHGEGSILSGAIIYTLLINVLGFPSTHVPLGLDDSGLPIGVQIVAGPNQDRFCFAVAKELEQQFGGWVPPS